MVKIHEVAPELEVLFMGAAALGLPGKNDLDLDILCEAKDIKRYADILIPVFGVPQEMSEEMAVWSYMRDGVEIDCILSDPARPNSHLPKQKKVFAMIKNNSKLQEQYKQLKIDCDGLPYVQYEAKKKEFLKELETL